MSAPGPTMKTIQKRIYTALPRAVASSSSSSTSSSSISRVRSNSVSSQRTLYTANPSSGPLSFFDTPPPPPPPPSSRPGNPHILSTSRLPVKGEGEGQSHSSGTHPQNAPHAQGQSSGPLPFSLALTSPQPGSSPPHAPASYQSSGFFPLSSFAPMPFYNVATADHADAHPRTKRQRMRYHLDVGAYGIPKRASGQAVAGRDGYCGSSLGRGKLFQGGQSEDLTLAVQVGEDAYFIRDNAMGVADGVGGWSKAKNFDHTAKYTPSDPSASALFARRLMHHCSAETDQAVSACQVEPTVKAPMSTAFSKPPLSASNKQYGSKAHHFYSPWSWDTDIEEMEEEPEDSLEELEEGLDVLMILERAYESTIKAHVVREPKTNDTRPISSTATSHLSSQMSSSSPSSPSVTMLQQQPQIPSTDSSNVPPSSSPPVSHPLKNSPEFIPLMAGSSTALLAVLEHAPHKSQRSSSPHPAADIPVGITTHDAVLKIAHLGDCMGMLVRDEEVVWRSEEMWWSFNTPVQLGPSSSARPKDAQILTLPVQADDILILASDGLSDNLWDEEVLDEVVRFKRSFLNTKSGARKQQDVLNVSQGLLGRRSLAGMLSEALCSRARRVSERRGTSCGSPSSFDDEVPFARRAREQGRSFRGGKIDDISVLVAVISPAADAPMSKS